MKFCAYYQACVERSSCWFFVGILRSFEHLAFDRTLDVEHSIFEFFVPEDLETDFLVIMKFFQEQGLVADLKKLPNRFEPPIQ